MTDLSGLTGLGRIAGIAGIALGVVALLIKPLIGAIRSVPAPKRSSLVQTIAIGTFSLGAAGVLAWVLTTPTTPKAELATHGDQSPAIVATQNASVTYGGQPPHPASQQAESRQTPRPTGSVSTQGANSPAISAGRDATVSYGPNYYGPNPDEVSRLVAGAAGPATIELASASRRLGLTEEALKTFLLAAGQEAVPTDQLVDRLNQFTINYKTYASRLSKLNGSNTITQPLVDNARAAVRDGRLEDANRYLGNIYLWRGALDALSFMPLLQANVDSGTIITDWYVAGGVLKERFKASAIVTGQEFRKDNFRVEINHQFWKHGRWVDAPKNYRLDANVQDRAFQRATALRSKVEDNSAPGRKVTSSTP